VTDSEPFLLDGSDLPIVIGRQELQKKVDLGVGALGHRRPKHPHDSLHAAAANGKEPSHAMNERERAVEVVLRMAEPFGTVAFDFWMVHFDLETTREMVHETKRRMNSVEADDFAHWGNLFAESRATAHSLLQLRLRFQLLATRQSSFAHFQ
jgi:hypothetical protein